MQCISRALRAINTVFKYALDQGLACSMTVTLRNEQDLDICFTQHGKSVLMRSFSVELLDQLDKGRENRIPLEEYILIELGKSINER